MAESSGRKQWQAAVAYKILPIKVGSVFTVFIAFMSSPTGLSAAKIVTDRATAIADYTSKAFFFNLNYMPDTILGGLLLFALIMQSVPMGMLGIVLLSLEFVHAGSSSFLAEVIPGVHVASKDVQRCSGHFPGISYERLITMATKIGKLTSLNNGFPSYYIMFIGALFGYITGVNQTYSKELDGMPKKRAAVNSGGTIMFLLAILFVIYRYATGCDSLISMLVGAVIGIIYGFIMESLIAYLSDRTLTNLLNIPQLRDRAEDGKPIYVCKKPTA